MVFSDLLTVVSDRIARPFNRSGATRGVALEISKVFDGVWHAGLLHILKSYGSLGQIFGLIFAFFSNRQLWVVLNGKSSEEYPVNTGVSRGSILGPTLFLLYINELPDDVICTLKVLNLASIKFRAIFYHFCKILYKRKVSKPHNGKIKYS